MAFCVSHLLRINFRSHRPVRKFHFPSSVQYSSKIHISPDMVKSISPKVLYDTNEVPDDVLEKFITALSTDIHLRNRIYKKDLLLVIDKIKEINFSTKEQGLLLLRCCTELLPDESESSRMTLVEEIWNAIKPHTQFELDHFHELLKVYKANKRTLTVTKFLQEMEPLKPTMTTYELILMVLAEAGDYNQTKELISNMKLLGLPETENVFNALIICEGKARNVKNIDELITTMNSIKLNKSIATYTALARAYAFNKMYDAVIAEMEKAQNAGLQFEQIHVMDIVKTLASIGAYAPIPQVIKFLPKETLSMPSISPYMQSVTTSLVYQNHPLAALEIYKCLPRPTYGSRANTGLNGKSLIKDAVKAGVPSKVIELITQELMSSGRNPIALDQAAEAALRQGKLPLALDLFAKMQQLQLSLRPHYFWPLFVHSSKSYREKGIMSVLSSMLNLKVQPDYETMMNYVLPYVSFTSPQNLIKKFVETGLNVSVVLTPIVVTLLQNGQVRSASEICEIYEGRVDAERLLKPLLKGYVTSLDLKSTIYILEDITRKEIDKTKNWTGRFLCEVIKHKKTKGDLSDVLNIINALKESRLKISTSACDFCISRLRDHNDLDSFRKQILNITDEKLVDNNILPNLNKMNKEKLSTHLVEFESKNENKHDDVRKLLLQYCREENLNAIREIVDKCNNEGIHLSAGTKAAVFDIYVKSRELDLAELTLNDLTKTAPRFTLDEFKIIDFATLLVYNKKINKAMEFISEQSKKKSIQGGRRISMNCWRLLNAIASQGNAAETRKMFQLLTSFRYCVPSNVMMMGPLIGVHIKDDNLEEALKEFVHLSGKYKKTPLKHELLCKILLKIGDGETENDFLVKKKDNEKYNKMAHTLLDIDKKVNGSNSVQLTMIAAFADVGYRDTLRNMFLDPTVRFQPDALLQRCKRFADEKKLRALENIIECGHDVKHVNVIRICQMMLDVYIRENDHEAVLALWNKMQDVEVTPSLEFLTAVASFFESNERQMPAEMKLLLSKQMKSSDL